MFDHLSPKEREELLSNLRKVVALLDQSAKACEKISSGIREDMRRERERMISRTYPVVRGKYF